MPRFNQLEHAAVRQESRPVSSSARRVYASTGPYPQAVRRPLKRPTAAALNKDKSASVINRGLLQKNTTPAPHTVQKENFSAAPRQLAKKSAVQMPVGQLGQSKPANQLPVQTAAVANGIQKKKPVGKISTVAKAAKDSGGHQQKQVAHRAAAAKAANNATTDQTESENLEVLGDKIDRQIRRWEDKTGFMMSKAGFELEARKAIFAVSGKKLNIEEKALDILQIYWEMYAEDLFRKATLCTKHGKRKTIFVEDIRLVREIREEPKLDQAKKSAGTRSRP